MNIEELEKVFNDGLKKNKTFIGVHIFMEGYAKPETIINRLDENGPAKLLYYTEVYDENLNHRFSKTKIQITGAEYGNTMSEIAWKLGEENVWKD